VSYKNIKIYNLYDVYILIFQYIYFYIYYYSSIIGCLIVSAKNIYIINVIITIIIKILIDFIIYHLLTNLLKKVHFGSINNFIFKIVCLVSKKKEYILIKNKLCKVLL
jgi:hypothetical protein